MWTLSPSRVLIDWDLIHQSTHFAVTDTTISLHAKSFKLNPRQSANAAATEQVYDGQKDDCADEGNQQGGQAEIVLIDGAGADHR